MREDDIVGLCKVMEDFCEKKGYKVNHIDLDVGIQYLSSMGEIHPFALEHIYTFKLSVGDK